MQQFPDRSNYDNQDGPPYYRFVAWNPESDVPGWGENPRQMAEAGWQPPTQAVSKPKQNFGFGKFAISRRKVRRTLTILGTIGAIYLALLLYFGGLTLPKFGL